MYVCIYVCMYVCMYVCVYVCMYVNLTDWGKSVRPGTLGSIKVGLTGEPNKSVTTATTATEQQQQQQQQIRSDPISADPLCPFLRARERHAACETGRVAERTLHGDGRPLREASHDDAARRQTSMKAHKCP